MQKAAARAIDWSEQGLVPDTVIRLSFSSRYSGRRTSTAAASGVMTATISTALRKKLYRSPASMPGYETAWRSWNWVVVGGR